MELPIPLIGPAVIAIITIWWVGIRNAPLWIQSIAAGAPVPPFTIVAMRWRRVDPVPVAGALVAARQAGIGVTIDQARADLRAAGPRPAPAP